MNIDLESASPFVLSVVTAAYDLAVEVEHEALLLGRNKNGTARLSIGRNGAEIWKSFDRVHGKQTVGEQPE